MNDSLREAFRKGLNSKVNGQFTTIAATVDAVDEQAYTIDVTPVGEGAEVFDVRLRASLDGSDTGLIQVPKVGSTVLISAINNNWNSAFLTLTSELEKLLVKVDDSTLEVKAGEIIINGGALGGLVKAKELEEQLNKHKKILEKLLGVINGAVLTQPSNAPSILQSTLKTALAGLQPGDFSNLENEKVKHG